jgi:hypothetical protein
MLDRCGSGNRDVAQDMALVAVQDDSQPLSSICPRRGVGSAHGMVTAACEAIVHMPLTSYDRCENDLEPPSDPTGIARIPASALSGHYLPEL